MLLAREKSLREASSRNFYAILNELAREILGDAIEPDNLIEFARLMGYHVSITKSWVTSVGLHHAWNNNLALLAWIS